MDIILRRFDPKKDMDNIYKVYSDYNEQHNLFNIMNLNSPERFPVLFERRLSNNYSDFFIITNQNDAFIGFVISYDYSPNDLHMKVMEYISPDYRNGIYTAIGLIKFMHILFSHYCIKKIYTEVYGFNTESLKSHSSFGFEEEARLKDYRYYKGRSWDFVIFSITKERFYEKYQKIITKCIDADEMDNG